MNIRAEGLKKSFGSHVLFENLSFEIRAGEMTCIYGVSGQGKTTLLNILGLIEEKDDGRIYYDGKLIKRGREKRKMLAERIGFVFQNFALMEDETVLENLMILKKLKGKKCLNEVTNALAKFGLEGFENRKVFELSGGEQQRVALTKLYLKDCDLILADEPTASLDQANKDNVLSILREFCSQGKTVVIVTHDLSLMEQCEKVIRLGGETI